MGRSKNPQPEQRNDLADTKTKIFCCSFCEKKFVDKDSLFIHFENVHYIDQAFRQPIEHSQGSEPLNLVSTKNDSININNFNKNDYPTTNMPTLQFLPKQKEQSGHDEVVSDSVLQHELMTKNDAEIQPAVSILPDPRYFNINTPQPASSATSLVYEVASDLCPITTNIIVKEELEIVDMHPETSTYDEQSIQDDLSFSMSTYGIDQPATTDDSTKTSNVQIATSVLPTSGVSIEEDYQTFKKRQFSEIFSSSSDEESLLTTDIMPISKIKIEETPVTTYNVLCDTQSTNQLVYVTVPTAAGDRMQNFTSMPPGQTITMNINNDVAFTALPTMYSWTPGFSSTPPNNDILQQQQIQSQPQQQMHSQPQQQMHSQPQQTLYSQPHQTLYSQTQQQIQSQPQQQLYPQPQQQIHPQPHLQRHPQTQQQSHPQPQQQSHPQPQQQSHPQPQQQSHPQPQQQSHQLYNSNLKSNVQRMRNKPIIPKSTRQYPSTATNSYGGNSRQRAQPYNIRPQGSQHLYNQTHVNSGWNPYGQQIPQFDSRNVQLDVTMQMANNAAQNQSMVYGPAYQLMLFNHLFGISAYQPNATQAYPPQQNNGSR